MFTNYKKASVSNYNVVLLLLGGMLAGAINGIIGSGAGIIMVLLLKKVVGSNQRQSQATAMLLVLPLALISAVIYIINGSLPLFYSLAVILGSAIGGVIGATLLNKCNNTVVSVIFSCMLIFAGMYMLGTAL